MMMFKISMLPAVVLTAAGLAACAGAQPTGSGAGSGATPSAAEQACLAAVSRTANNGDVVLLGSEFSQAGTYVRVGVGAQRAPWKCIAYSNGSTGGVEYLGKDG